MAEEINRAGRRAGGSGSKTRVGVLLSGRGSNFAALSDAMIDGRVTAEIAVVISNIENAAGLELARQRGIDTVVLPHREQTREMHERSVVAALHRADIEWVCLAGYMRLLSAGFLAAFAERVLNIHPSLLPAFPGLHPQRQAIMAGVRVSGCTVHFVDAGLDSGPIIEQRTVPVHEADDEESLAARILVEEHRAYPAALQALLDREWRIEGKRLLIGNSRRGG